MVNSKYLNNVPVYALVCQENKLKELARFRLYLGVKKPKMKESVK